MNQSIKLTSHRGISIFVAVLLIATVAPQILSTKTAFAGDGYPWDNATCLSGTNWSGTSGTYDWGYTPLPCPSNDPNCLSYPYPNGTNPTGGMGDTWGYNVRNCTSYVAYKINQQFTKSIAGWGNAKDWNGAALAAGYTDDTTPQVGDIAQWTTGGGGFGHVAYVGAVDPNTHVATYWEYNAATTGAFTNTGTSTSEGAPSNWIHIGTISGGGTGSVQMLLNSSNQVFAENSSPPWTSEASSGITAISAGGSTQMLLDSSGNVWVENTVGSTGWSEEVVGGTVAIAAGSNVKMLLNSSNQVFAKTGTGPWTYEAGGGITALAAAGSTQMILNSSGNVYAETSVGAGFVNEVTGGTTAIDVGDDGTQMLLNTSTQLYERNGIGSTWTYQNTGNSLISAG